MHKDDAIRKVLACINLAENPGATDGEREAAHTQAVKLRLKFGISDQELEQQDLDEFEFFGSRVFWFGNHMKPHVDSILAEIDRALAKADKLDPLNKLKAYCEFYKKVNDHIASTAFQPWDTLKQRRDKVVEQYYTAAVEERWQQDEEFAREHPQWSQVDRKDLNDQLRVHERALFNTSLYADLRKDTIENIVKVHSMDFHVRMWAEDDIKKAKKEGCTCDPWIRVRKEGRKNVGWYLEHRTYPQRCPLYDPKDRRRSHAG